MAHECIGEIALLVYNVLQQELSAGHGIAFDDVIAASAVDVASVASKAT